MANTEKTRKNKKEATVKKSKMPEKLHYWKDMYHYADQEYSTTQKAYVERREARYNGTASVYDGLTIKSNAKKTPTVNNIVREMIETQINNGVPAPKVKSRDADNDTEAMTIENYLKEEIVRLDSEKQNDVAERQTYLQGTFFYLIGWDNTQTTPFTEGELFVQTYPIDRVRPQPGVYDIKEMEYIFLVDYISRAKLSRMYGIKETDIALHNNSKDLSELITCYYFNKDGNLSRYGWVDDVVIFDEENYMFRKFRVCTKCDTSNPYQDECITCKNKKFKYDVQSEEELAENLTTKDGKIILANKGDTIPYYRVNELPIVVRVNVSQKDSFYGSSDADILENQQNTMNKLTTKITENQLKAGSIVFKPNNMKINKNDDTLKIVNVKSPKDIEMVQVKSIQANIQQDDIWISRLYNMGRNSVGITDSYQGKRDPTAESGKAKEIAAAQANGRLESKRRMKDAAYSRLYELMFKFLLAFCDEKRTYREVTEDGTVRMANFSRYDFIEKNENTGAVYYNDRYLFDVDNASILSTNRELMWRETTNNFQSGTFGNPADPNTLMLYWNTMKGLGYPLAEQSLTSIQNRTQQLPQEIQNVILQNPEILQQLQQLLQSKEGESKNGVQNSKQQNND